MKKKWSLRGRRNDQNTGAKNIYPPVEIQLKTNSKNLYLFFGGIASGIAMPPFEFYNYAKIMHENKIFIRDIAQCWYQCGLPGISSDIPSTLDFIQKNIEIINPDKVFFVGNSMGGYAAIIFGELIGKGEVVAFAPQTFISPYYRLLHGDNRWRKKIFNTYKISLFKTKIWDTRPLLRRNSGTPKISLFVSRRNRLDYIHALHLKSIPKVTIFEFNGGGHGVVKLLRDEGRLPEIMSGNYAR